MKLTWKSPRLRGKVLATALLLAFVTYGFFTWVLWPVKVSGESMMPNYRDGSRHFINKLAYRSASPQRGDVVGLRALNGDIYMKRVIGLPGESLTFENGTVQINGRALQEPYLESRIFSDIESITLGTNQYWMMGDNRPTSIRGAYSAERIVGKVVF